MPRHPAGIAAALAVACAFLSPLGVRAGNSKDGHSECAPSHVRLTDALMQGAFDMGMERSATFRGLVESLRGSDLIVYASSELTMPMPIVGEIHFLTTAGTHRYLRVLIRADLSPWERAAMLAHELQHAREIAEAPWVWDVATMDQYYEVIGYRVGIDRHETDAARAIAAIVQREVTPGLAAGGSR